MSGGSTFSNANERCSGQTSSGRHGADHCHHRAAHVTPNDAAGDERDQHNRKGKNDGCKRQKYHFARPNETVQNSVSAEHSVYARQIHRRHEDLNDRVNQTPRLKDHQVH